MPTIAISNQKGGVGKTTLTVHLAAYLATQGLRVLVADADPQANATAWLCGGERHQSAFWRLLIAREKVENVLVTGRWGVGLLPGSDETGRCLRKNSKLTRRIFSTTSRNTGTG